MVLSSLPEAMIRSIRPVESHTGDEASVALERRQFLARGQIPQPDGLIPTRRRHVLAIGADGNTADAGVVTAEKRL